jgi:TRAP-type C4-dicarboxylate transport system substrate-binding protein
MYRSFLSTLKFFAVAALCCLWAQTSTAATRWKCYTYLPSATDPVYARLLKLAEQIKTATNGRVNMTCDLGGSIPMKSGNIMQAVASGVLQFGTADSESYTGFIPFAGIISLPGMFSSNTALVKGYETIKPTLTKFLQKNGVRLLGNYHYPKQVIWSVNPIKSLDELKGVKIRVTTPEQAEFAKKFGALPITLGTPEVSSALQSGIISAALTASSGGGRMWIDQVHYNYRVGPNYVTILLVANESAYSKLSPEDQKQVSALVEKAGEDMSNILSSTEIKVTKELEKKGLKVFPSNTADEKLIREKMQPYWSQWAKAKGPEAQKLLKAVTAASNQ